MAEQSRPNPNDLIRLLGIANVCRACKSFLSKRHTDKKQPLFLKKISNKPKPKQINDTKITRSKTKKHNAGRKGDDKRRGKGRFKQGTDYQYNQAIRSPQCSGSPRLSRNLSYNGRRTQPPAKGPFSRSLSQKESMRGAGDGGLTHTFSRSTSRGAATPIIFSNSSGLIKPAAMEKQLECTLEELCFGCVKKVAITRDTVKGNGQIVEEDELVTIKVKPGWRIGTKITFEGKGNQMPGTEAADVVFVIAEKEHPLFKRQ